MTLLKDRYEILDQIGQGGQGVTFKALDHQSGQIVAIKRLDMQTVDRWKDVELFEREANTLGDISHPGVPMFIEAFTLEADNSATMHIVQQFIDGEDFSKVLASKGRWSPSAARQDLMAVLRILAALHRRVPPIVHRDIKPANLIRSSEGHVVLVDFGAVQTQAQATVGGSTVIGTPGYMPIEQMTGQTLPASDLYALGVTFCHLITGDSPEKVPLSRAKLSYRDRLSPDLGILASVLDRMIEPTLEDRFQSATEVLDALEHGALNPISPPSPSQDSDDLPKIPAKISVELLFQRHSGSRRYIDAIVARPPSLSERIHTALGASLPRRLDPEKLFHHSQIARKMGFRIIRRDTWFSPPLTYEADYLVSPDGATTMMEMGPWHSYYFATFFSDGTWVISTPQPLKDNPRAGCTILLAPDDTELAYRQHLKAVNKTLQRGVAPLYGPFHIDEYLRIFGALAPPSMSYQRALINQVMLTILFLGFPLLWFLLRLIPTIAIISLEKKNWRFDDFRVRRQAPLPDDHEAADEDAEAVIVHEIEG